jgi:hypothetical protein
LDNRVEVFFGKFKGPGLVGEPLSQTDREGSDAGNVGFDERNEGVVFLGGVSLGKEEDFLQLSQNEIVNGFDSRVKELRGTEDDFSDKFSVFLTLVDVKESLYDPVSHFLVVGSDGEENGTEPGFVGDKKVGQVVKSCLDLSDDCFLIGEDGHGFGELVGADLAHDLKSGVFLDETEFLPDVRKSLDIETEDGDEGDRD